MIIQSPILLFSKQISHRKHDPVNKFCRERAPTTRGRRQLVRKFSLATPNHFDAFTDTTN